MTTLAIAPMPATEAAIVAAVIANLDVLGPIRGLAEEVPSHGRSRADVAALVEDALVLIEAKRTAWQRAIAQAAMNRLCCDRSFIALWSGRATPAVLSEAKRLGVGVLTVHGGGLELVLDARRREPSPGVRQAIVDRIHGASS